MVQKLDLAAIAEQVESPYHTIPLVNLGAADVSLFICQGARSWHRRLPREHMLMVTEGVITVDAASAKTVVSEGEVATIPAEIGYNAYSGMRSTVLSIESVRHEGRYNGHETPPAGPHGSISRFNAAVAVRKAPEFHWLASGSAGAAVAVATRLRGNSGLYVAPAGSLLLVVYRGVLDFRSEEEEGTAVGSQMLHVAAGEAIALRSEHGATVVAVAPRDVPLPAPATAGSAPWDVAESGSTTPED